jgi:hypothetical protein
LASPDATDIEIANGLQRVSKKPTAGMENPKSRELAIALQPQKSYDMSSLV